MGFNEIIEITTERVRRAAAGVKGSKDAETKQGLGGSFTFCFLGAPIDLERFFDGEGAPTYEQIARYVVYTATGTIGRIAAEPRKDWFVAEAGGYRIHLIYKPDIAFMRSNEAALSLRHGEDKSRKAPRASRSWSMRLRNSCRRPISHGAALRSASFLIRSIACWARLRMRLKDYQSGALDTLSAYLKLLAESAAKAEKTIAAIALLPEDVRASVPAPQEPTVAAWDEARKNGVAASPDPWRELKDGTGRSIPHICLKLPTGGGKTLLAAHGVDRIMVSHFRQTTGFVLWIVPSDAIYTQTKAQLADRESPDPPDPRPRQRRPCQNSGKA